MIKKLLKLFVVLTLVFAMVPTESWNAFAIDSSAEPVIVQTEENEVSETQLPEEVVLPSATPETTPVIDATPEVTPTVPEVEKIEEVKEINTTLLTIHSYIENDEQVNREIIIEDLIVGQEINARNYALAMDGYTLATVSAEILVLADTNNVVYYNYDYQSSIERPEITINSSAQPSKARIATRTSNDEPGAVFVTKEARWVDEQNGYAAIDFTVKGNPVITGSDVLLIVDNSQSMVNGVDRWTPLKESVQAFVSKLYEDVDGKPSTNKIGMISFSDSAYPESKEKFLGVNDEIIVGNNERYNSVEFYQQEVWKYLKPNGNATNYEDAFRYATNMFNNIDNSRPRFIIFLSDGVPNKGNYDTAKSYADELKADGIKVYSLGLQLDPIKESGNETYIPFDKYIQPLASEPASQYAKDIKELAQLQPIYEALAGEMKIAGTQGVITDVINDEIFSIANKPGSSISFEATHGTAEVKGNEVTWSLGDITETEKKLTIYVRVSNSDAVGLVETNKSADIDYIDYNNAPQNKDIPNAALTIGDKGSIKMNYYLVDANGKLISQSGAELTDFSKRVVLKTEMYEKDGNSVLDFGTYLLNPPSSFELNGTKYVLVNDAEYSTPIGSRLIINNINKDQNAYYGYKEYNVPPFIFYTKHYLENADGTFEEQFPSTKYEIPTNLDEILYAKDYVNDAYLTNYTFVENHPSSKPEMNNGDTQNNYMTLYYTRIIDNTEYTVNHIVNGTTTSEKVEGTIWRGETDKTIVVTSESLQPKTNGNYAGYKIGTIKDGAGNDIIPGSKVSNNSIITINYVKDETQTKEVSYKVKHTLPNGLPVEVVVNKTVWINDADELEVTADSIATKAPVGYKLDTIKDTAGKTITAGDVVADKTEIEVTYVKDDTQTKSINYKVEHKINGIVRDTDNETITVWTNATQGTPNSIKVKTYTGYKVDQASLDAVPTVVTEGTVITINYVKDETQTKEVSYKVKHTLPNGLPVEVVVNKTVWINDADELEVTADSIATKAPVGYKLDTIKDTAGKTITAGDVVADKTEIEVTYVKDDTQTKDIHYSVEHKIDGTVQDIDSETITVWVNATEGTPNIIKVKTYTGYKVDQASLDAVPTVVIEGTVITINYVKDDTQTKEIKYTVEHWLEGNSVATTTTDFIETVWINAPDTLVVTANSIAQKSFSGFSYSGISPSIKANDSVNDKTIIKIYYSKNPNPVTPPVDPTPEPTPEVFVPVVPNPNPRNPQPEVVPDDNTPEVAPTAKPTATPETITDETTPEVAGRSWALINLIASLIGMLLTIVLLFAKHEKEEENEENQEVKDEFERKRIYKVIGVIVAVISIVIFLLTENITLPMKLVDKYTVLMIVFALGNILCFYLGRRWHEVEDEEVEEQIQA